MAQQTANALTELYEADETAWLETMAKLIRARRYGELDYRHLREYLSDMAKRDKREVQSRLTVLIAHLLKWLYQPEKRSGSWRATILVQQQALAPDLEGGSLRRHAQTVLDRVYRNAVEQAAAETELPTERFPAECPFTLEELLSRELHEN
jgi:hypothetical protein